MCLTNLKGAEDCCGSKHILPSQKKKKAAYKGDLFFSLSWLEDVECGQQFLRTGDEGLLCSASPPK